MDGQLMTPKTEKHVVAPYVPSNEIRGLEMFVMIHYDK